MMLMLPEDEDKLARMNLSINTFGMSLRQPFLNADDYMFYLRLHIEKEKRENYDEDDRIDNNYYPQKYNSELPKLSELLRKLGEDLQLAFDNFVNDFVDNDGIYCLLNLLRLCLNRQQSPGTNRTSETDSVSNFKNKSLRSKDRHHQLKRALNDEYDSLVCLNSAVKRNSRALQKMISHHAGLSTLASCIVSNLTKSRLIALQLLTKVCDRPEGVNKVLEAMSTMRIIFGESVRFKFLIAMLNSGNNSTTNGIECNALSLLNALLSKTSNVAERIRLQCELEEAGLHINQFEQTLRERGVQKDQQIWTELKKFRKEYINVSETLISKKHTSEESVVLKEEVELLQRALSKLEEDKINLMTIERELKEKCEDLELEVDHLKCKFTALVPTNKKLSKHNGSDNGTGDSGQWSDSDGDLITDSAKDKLGKMPIKQIEERETKSTYNVDQNMRNEDEFIYIPAIKPPANFAQYEEQEEKLNGFRNKSSNSNSARKTRILSNDNNKDDSRWRQRQRHFSSGHTLTDKPTVVNMHPKRDKVKGNYPESAIGMDRGYSELILDLNYTSLDPQIITKTEYKETECNFGKNTPKMSSFRNISSSMNQINKIKERFEYRNDSHVSNKKASQHWLSNDQNNLSDGIQLKSLSETSRTNFSQSNGSLYKTSIKAKNITSLQSYFFSGSSSLKQNKLKFHSVDSFEESPKSFPIPKTYKRNFIIKGHGNCGLYSGSADKDSFSNNLSDDIKNGPLFDNRSALVHKEITEAARDIGAWL